MGPKPKDKKQPAKVAATKTKQHAKTSGIDEIDSMFATKKKMIATTQLNSAKTNKESKPQRRDPRNEPSNPAEWVNDGLGGKYNGEGYTGRVEDGIKIFKAHVLNKKNSGQTAECPFDCDCCLI